MLSNGTARILGKIAADVERAVAERERRGDVVTRRATRIASGAGWRVGDVICTSGPADHRFVEEHALMSVGVVVAGTFQHRSSSGEHILTPGSFLLGNAGQCFECGHEHATGDRCVAFQYEPEFFDRIAASLGVREPSRGFRASRIPALRASSSLVTRIALSLGGAIDVSWEEIAVEAAGLALSLAGSPARRVPDPSPAAVARVTESVRTIERDPSAPATLESLAASAGQSTFHYLRTFRRLTGVTPHQFILRSRLRHAAARLATERAKVIEVALGAGFNDLSNFNRAFRAELGVTPRAYRQHRTRHY